MIYFKTSDKLCARECPAQVFFYNFIGYMDAPRLDLGRQLVTSNYRVL